MKKLSTVLLLIILLQVVGCGSVGGKPVVLHPTLGTALMILPKGVRVGPYETPDKGVFMTGDVFANMVEELVEKVGDEYKKFY